MKPWGFAIPGLAMNARELPMVSGLVRLQQPGFDELPDIDTPYSIEDLASFHLKAILSEVPSADDLLIIGMSMGGMIASVLATRLRHQLPAKTRFRFLVTSSNHPDLPCITKGMLAEWYKARPGDQNSFAAILTPFVGRTFREANPAATAQYFDYRATGKNGQSTKAFIKQMTAVTSFDGTSYFKEMCPDEVEFFHGGSDEIMTRHHRDRLRQLQPHARHHVISDLGHMVNFEAPHLFYREVLTNA